MRLRKQAMAHRICALLFLGIFLAASGCFAKGLTRRHAEPPRVGIPLETPLYDFAGVLHIHSSCSGDSEATWEEIVDGGADSGCDFLVVTDHNNSDLQDREGFHRGVLLLVGAELSTQGGHLLALGLEDAPARDRPVPALIGEIAEKGGVTIVAHPCRRRGGWTGGEDGFDGMEIFNLGSAFQKADRVGLVLSLILRYPFDRRGVAARFVKRPDEELALYDRISSTRHIALFGGADAHMPPVVGSLVDLYSHVFPIVRIHVLAPELSASGILDGMKRGRAYVAFDIFADATGFHYHALLPGGKAATMGEKVPFQPGIRLRGTAPEEGAFVLYRNGAPCVRSRGSSFEYSPGEGGVYRLEVSRRCGKTWTPWIYSNPIWLD
jgi:hypothetical protein